VEDFQKWINMIKTVQGVQHAFIIDYNGNNLSEKTDDPENVKKITALCQTLSKLILGISNNLNKRFIDSYSEFEKNNITIEKIVDNRILVIISSKESNLGKIRLELKKIKSTLIQE
jgi:predicted regulator of Ras-like GTPase activity (Roadblock/LC7/MglB family)